MKGKLRACVWGCVWLCACVHLQACMYARMPDCAWIILLRFLYSSFFLYTGSSWNNSANTDDHQQPLSLFTSAGNLNLKTAHVFGSLWNQAWCSLSQEPASVRFSLRLEVLQILRGHLKNMQQNCQAGMCLLTFIDLSSPQIQQLELTGAPFSFYCVHVERCTTGCETGDSIWCYLGPNRGFVLSCCQARSIFGP